MNMPENQRVARQRKSLKEEKNESTFFTSNSISSIFLFMNNAGGKPRTQNRKIFKASN